MTAFVIDSYKLLQPDDNQQYIATALYALVIATNSSAAQSLVSPPSSSSSAASSLPRWINGLWFTSLFLALAAALLCILVKQWLDEYSARTRISAKNPRYWARRHAFYFHGVDDWNVPAIISILPLLLHLALFLFLAGVAALLWNLDLVIAGFLVSFALILGGGYAVCTLLPLLYPACPYSTPILQQMRKAWIMCRIFTARRMLQIQRTFERLGCFMDVSPHILGVYHSIHRFTAESVHRLRCMGRTDEEDPPDASTPQAQTLEQRLTATIARLEGDKLLNAFDRVPASKDAAKLLNDALDSAALQWLIVSVSDSDANAVALQALSALDPESSLAALLRAADIVNLATAEKAVPRTAAGTWNATDVARTVRGLLCMGAGGLTWRFWHYIPSPMMDVLKAAEYPDMALIWATRDMYTDNYPPGARTPSSTSTVRLLLCLQGLHVRHVVHLLACAALDELTTTDWDHIFAALRESRQPPCSLVHPEQGCDVRCFAEALTYFIVHGYEMLSDKARYGAATRLVTRVFALTNTWTGTQLTQLPSLLAYMASPHFITQDYETRALSNVFNMLADPEKWLSLDEEMETTAFRALGNLLHVRADPEHKAEPFQTLDSLRVARLVTFFVHDPADAHRDWTGWRDWNFPAKERARVMPVHWFLLPTESGIVIWRALWALTPARYHDIVDAHVRLATELSFALCALVRRGDDADTEHMVDAFLAELPLVGLLRQVASQASYSRYPFARHIVPVFELLAQHCAELRPSWWRTRLEMFARQEQDGRLRDFALKIDQTVQQMGPCVVCPERPRLSVCSFEPCA